MDETSKRCDYDLVIVGAGIVGAACAEEAARRGLRTLVVDRSAAVTGATAAAMGHIVVMDSSHAQFALTEYSRRLWNERAASLPDEVEFDPCGTLWVAANADEMAVVERKYAYYHDRGIDCEILNAARLRQWEPNLRSDLLGGLRVPGDAVVYPPCAAAHLLTLAVGHGAKLRNGVSVTRMGDDGTVTLADGTTIRAGTCVNAAGCGASDLSPAYSVRKRKGHLVITDRYPGYVRHQVIELAYSKSTQGNSNDSVAFNIQPRKNGQMLIGSSRQFGADDSDVEFDILGRMIERAAIYLPKLYELQSVRAWAGHRPATTDGLPLVGPQKEGSRVWLAAGHEGLGITTSLATARLLVDQLLGVPTEIPAEPYSTLRFVTPETTHA